MIFIYFLKQTNKPKKVIKTIVTVCEVISNVQWIRWKITIVLCPK